MDPTTRNSVIGGAVVAAAIVGAVVMSGPPPPKKVYPRIIQPRTMSDATYAALMASKLKTNIPGTTIYIKSK